MRKLFVIENKNVKITEKQISFITDVIAVPHGGCAIIVSPFFHIPQVLSKALEDDSIIVAVTGTDGDSMNYIFEGEIAIEHTKVMLNVNPNTDAYETLINIVRSGEKLSSKENATLEDIYPDYSPNG